LGIGFRPFAVFFRILYCPRLRAMMVLVRKPIYSLAARSGQISPMKAFI
jgi:predicted membrane protein